MYAKEAADKKRAPATKPAPGKQKRAFYFTTRGIATSLKFPRARGVRYILICVRQASPALISLMSGMDRESRRLAQGKKKVRCKKGSGTARSYNVVWRPCSRSCGQGQGRFFLLFPWPQGPICHLPAPHLCPKSLPGFGRISQSPGQNMTKYCRKMLFAILKGHGKSPGVCGYPFGIT